MKTERWNPATHLNAPLHWRKPRLVTVADVYDDAAWAVMALTPQHVYEVTATEPERMAEYTATMHARLSIGGGITVAAAAIEDSPNPARTEMYFPRVLPNIRLGTTIRDQAEANAKLPPLLQCPAAYRFVDVVPRGPIHFGMIPFQSRSAADAGWNHGPLANDWQVLYGNAIDGFRATSMCSGTTVDERIHHIRVRGETGPDAAPLHPDHVRSLRDQAVAAGVPFAFLGWGEWAPGTYGYDSESPGWISSVGGTLHMETMFPGDEDGVRMSAWAKRNIHTLTKTSSWCDPLTIHSGECMVRVGKRAAGRLLDGREWNEMPQTRQEETP